jgi:REP element-mobilizing transposase RayT
MPRFQGTYRVDSARLAGRDYAAPGWYFVTICTKDRACFFGRVRDGVVGLSQAGCIAAQEWQKTPQVRPQVRLDAWVVMPNHVHGLIGITSETPAAPGDGDGDRDGTGGGDGNPPVVVETPRRGVSTAITPPDTDNQDKPLKPHSVGAIVGQIKSVCTKRIRRTARPDFGWQSRFHDRVVRNDAERRRIRRYIRANPRRWPRDRNRPDRLP